MVATLVALLAQVNVTPLMMLPLLSLAVARNCCVPPVPMEGEEGETEIVAIVGLLTVVESLVEAADAVPPPDTAAWFTWGEVAVADTFTVTVIGGKLAPVASVSLRSQVFAPPAPGHVQPVPAMDTKVSPDGTVSVTVTVPLVAPAAAPLLTDTE
jgi:hypothetical protein